MPTESKNISPSVKLGKMVTLALMVEMNSSYAVENEGFHMAH